VDNWRSLRSTLVLILSRKDLQKVLTMRETISVLEEAFRELVSGKAVMPTRISIPLPQKSGWIGIMPAYLEGLNAFSTKIVTVYGGNLSRGLPTTMATVVLNDSETGKMLSIMDGSYVTALRTGGLGGLAAKYLSREDSHVVGIFGAGVQARTQLIALAEVRNVTRVKVYDPLIERARSFAEEMHHMLAVPVEVCSTNNEAVIGVDIVVTVSTSKAPLFNGRLLVPGMHINAFGNFKPDERELDTETIKRSRITVDFTEASLSEAGDLIIPINEGAISRSQITAGLGEIVVGSKVGRSSSEEITLFKSVGLGIQDCAVASVAYERAIVLGVGTEIDLG